MYSTRYSCPILMKFDTVQQILEKYQNIKFHENQFSESRVPCGQTDVTKLIVVLRNFKNEPKNAFSSHSLLMLSAWYSK
jgi:hypothetical protein